MKRSKFITNVFANYLGRTWAIISIYIFIPLYISFLGIESYGVIAFFGTITGIVSLADFGLTTTFSRELAKTTDEASGYRESLFKTLSLIYGVLIVIIIFLFIVFSNPIASSWLQAETIPVGVLSSSIQLMGVAGGLQLFASFFIGGLIGLERQVTSNLLQITWGLFRALGSVAVLSISSTIVAFLYWHILSNALYLFFSWAFLKGCFNKSIGKIDFNLVRGHYLFASKMMLISLISSINLQIDKLLISKLLSVSYFGFYSVAATLAQAPIVLANPISSAILPRFTFFFAENRANKVWALYSLVGFLISILVIPISFACAIFSKEVIYLWTQNVQIAENVEGVSRWLMLGSMFQALQIMPFNLSIAYGYMRATIVLAISFLISISTLLTILIPIYELEGAGAAWFFTNVTLTIPYILFVNNRILPGISKFYIFKSICTVMLPSLLVFFFIRLFFSHDSKLLMPLVGVGLVVVVVLSFFLFFQSSPKSFINKVSSILDNP